MPGKKYDAAQKMNFSIRDFFRKCDQIRRELRYLITFTEEISNGKLYFLCSAKICELHLRCLINIKLWSKYTESWKQKKLVRKYSMSNNSEADPEPCQISEMESFAKIVNGWKQLTEFWIPLSNRFIWGLICISIAIWGKRVEWN